MKYVLLWILSRFWKTLNIFQIVSKILHSWKSSVSFTNNVCILSLIFLFFQPFFHFSKSFPKESNGWHFQSLFPMGCGGKWNRYSTLLWSWEIGGKKYRQKTLVRYVNFLWENFVIVFPEIWWQVDKLWRVVEIFYGSLQSLRRLDILSYVV